MSALSKHRATYGLGLSPFLGGAVVTSRTTLIATPSFVVFCTVNERAMLAQRTETVASSSHVAVAMRELNIQDPLGVSMAQGTDGVEKRVGVAVEDVEVRGHIIDSLILPKILDCICAGGGVSGSRISPSARRTPTRAMHWWRFARPTNRRLPGSSHRSPTTERCR